MFNCPHTGVALAALIKLLKAGKIDKSERVVVISTAHGLKFIEMKVKYHQRELDFPCRYANQPLQLPPRLDAVKEALEKAVNNKERTLTRPALSLKRNGMTVGASLASFACPASSGANELEAVESSQRQEHSLDAELNEMKIIASYAGRPPGSFS